MNLPLIRDLAVRLMDLATEINGCHEKLGSPLDRDQLVGVNRLAKLYQQFEEPFGQLSDAMANSIKELRNGKIREQKQIVRDLIVLLAAAHRFIVGCKQVPTDYKEVGQGPILASTLTRSLVDKIDVCEASLLLLSSLAVYV